MLGGIQHQPHSACEAAVNREASVSAQCGETQTQVEALKQQVEAALECREGQSQLQSQVASVLTSQSELQTSISALRAQVASARERHCEIGSMQEKLAEATSHIEKLHAQSEVVREQLRDIDSLRQNVQQLVCSKPASPVEAAEEQSCTESTASGLTTSVSEVLQENVFKLKTDAQETQFLLDEFKARILMLEGTCQGLRAQVEENMREDGEKTDEALLDRFELLQAEVNNLTTEQGITRSNLENTDRITKEANAACRQILEMVPNKRDLCRWSDLEEYVAPKLAELRDDYQKRISRLSDTLSAEFARSIPLQVTSHARAAVNSEVEILRKELSSSDLIGNHSFGEMSGSDSNQLQRLAQAVQQLSVRFDSLKDRSDQVALLSNESDVLCDLHRLANTHVEDLQMRVGQLEMQSRGTIASMQADLETQSLRMDELAQGLVNAGLSHNKELHSVSEDIKDYIQGLIVKLDPDAGSQDNDTVPSSYSCPTEAPEALAPVTIATRLNSNGLKVSDLAAGSPPSVHMGRLINNAAQLTVATGNGMSAAAPVIARGNYGASVGAPVTGQQQQGLTPASNMREIRAQSPTPSVVSSASGVASTSAKAGKVIAVQAQRRH